MFRLYIGDKEQNKPGIDSLSIQDFEANLDEERSQLQQDLATWTYQLSSVHRVEIPRQDGKGVRLLGIPTVRDRVVQTTLKLLLESIFDPYFSPNSYGFRQYQAVQQIVNSGKPHGVDIVLSKFFVALSDKVKFLGFTVVNGTIAIAHKALQTAMDKVKALTPRGTHKSVELTLDKINQCYEGWSNYYGLTNYPSQLHKIEATIRRRLRSRLVSQQKRKQHLYRNLVKRGVPRKQASKTVFSNNKQWVLSNAGAVTRAYPKSWFINLKGQEIQSDQKLAHWFEVSQWIRLA